MESVVTLSDAKARFSEIVAKAVDGDEFIVTALGVEVFRGFGFVTADSIAMTLGIEKTAMVRVRGAVALVPVPGQAAGHDGEDVGAQIGGLDPRQDQDARIVVHQRQVLLAQLG